MRYCREPDSHIRYTVKLILDLSNYATKLNYVSKIKSLYIALLHSIKHSEYKVEIKFDKDPLVVAQNN